MTNVRHLDPDVMALLAALRELVREGRARSFETGDLVDRITREHRLPVGLVARQLGASRTRLCELRRTARAFPPRYRRKDIDFHFFTVAARAAAKLGMKPHAALKRILDSGVESTRMATRMLAETQRSADAMRSAASIALVAARNGELIDRWHHADCRLVLPRLAHHSVKLVIADPPYGQYGRFADGRHATATATRRACDNLVEADARGAVVDLLRIAGTKMSPGGCLVLFRPGATLDPPWLGAAIDEHGWACERALTWAKGKTQLGRGDEPYGIGSERLLVLCRAGDRLVAHDGGDRGDVLSFKPVRPRYADGGSRHLFEKPADLMAHLIGKHTRPGELVVEPFGGTGPASRAAIMSGRRWVYCESHKDNFELGAGRIAEASAAAESVADAVG